MSVPILRCSSRRDGFSSTRWNDRKQKLEDVKSNEEVKPKEEIKEVKPKVDQQQSGDMPSGREVKPIKKKKVIKKIVYQEASSSDSDDAD